jgi:hypothetical protein
MLNDYESFRPSQDVLFAAYYKLSIGLGNLDHRLFFRSLALTKNMKCAQIIKIRVEGNQLKIV